jgi:K+-transporting ATPase KdpF subunit
MTGMQILAAALALALLVYLGFALLQPEKFQ